MVMVGKVVPTEEMDEVAHKVMVTEVMETAGEGAMRFSKKSKLLHNRQIICGITRQPCQQPLIMAQ